METNIENDPKDNKAEKEKSDKKHDKLILIGLPVAAFLLLGAIFFFSYISPGRKEITPTKSDQINEDRLEVSPGSEDIEGCLKIPKTKPSNGPDSRSGFPADEDETINPETVDRDRCIADIVDRDNLTDRTICSKIVSPYFRYLCLREVAINLKDPSLCTADLLGSKGNAEICLNELAIAMKNLSLCDRSTNREICISGYAIEAGDIDLCDQVNDRDWCLDIIGSNKSDLSICNQIVTDFRRENCIANVAEGLRDASLCMQLSKDQIDFCILRVAEKTHDSSLCDKVSEKKKEGCLEMTK